MTTSDGVSPVGSSVMLDDGADWVTVTNVVGSCVGTSTTELVGVYVTETVVVYPIVWSTVWVTTEAVGGSAMAEVGATTDVSVGAPGVTVTWLVTVSIGCSVTVTWDPAALDVVGTAAEPPLKICLADALS